MTGSAAALAVTVGRSLRRAAGSRLLGIAVLAGTVLFLGGLAWM